MNYKIKGMNGSQLCPRIQYLDSPSPSVPHDSIYFVGQFFGSSEDN